MEKIYHKVEYVEDGIGLVLHKEDLKNVVYSVLHSSTIERENHIYTTKIIKIIATQLRLNL